MDVMNRRLVPVESVMTITVDEDLVLVDQRSGQYFGLNEIGTAIWRQLEQGREMAAIVEAILSEYDASEEVVVADMQRILTELVAAGLIQ